MSDNFVAWKLMQDKMIAVQQAQVNVMGKIMGMGANFDGAVAAAREVAEANKQAWDAWMAMWGKKG